MTLRIERVSEGHSTMIRLIGRMRAEHLEELQAQINSSGQKPILDLAEVSLVDLEVVRFLGMRQLQGVELRHCSPYIKDWITKERVSTQ
jgi:anti-anti-sigma regulatory factor